jgi:hypothetical protein
MKELQRTFRHRKRFRVPSQRRVRPSKRRRPLPFDLRELPVPAVRPSLQFRTVTATSGTYNFLVCEASAFVFEGLCLAFIVTAHT